MVNDSVVVYCDEAPDFEPRGGMFHITYRSGDRYFRFVETPQQFAAARLKSDRAWAQWQVAQMEAEPVPLRGRRQPQH